MNLSWPHKGALGDGKPISVNAGMSRVLKKPDQLVMLSGESAYTGQDARSP
jgi:hypothetical protein